MENARASARRPLWVFALVCVAIFVATRLQTVPVIGPYVHLLVAAILLLTAIAMTRADPRHYGVALAGLLEPPSDDRPAGPLGLFDLARATIEALPAALAELGVAVAIAIVVFPLYAVGYVWWTGPHDTFALALPPQLGSVALAQLVVVALPEEAFFRGYLQTTLSDASAKRISLCGVELSLRAWLVQGALFAALHFIVEPELSRLAVFFPGLLFGWVRAWRGGIGAAMALHAMSNLYSEILARSWL